MSISQGGGLETEFQNLGHFNHWTLLPRFLPVGLCKMVSYVTIDETDHLKGSL
jgi:hypothetical protein